MSVFPRENHRTIAHSTVDFKMVKDIKNTCPKGTTVNDVVLTAFTGAIRRYMASEKDPALDLPDDPLMRSFCAASMPDLKSRVDG
jgi:NRPS condensation-like uncharacterized protein